MSDKSSAPLIKSMAAYLSCVSTELTFVFSLPGFYSFVYHHAFLDSSVLKPHSVSKSELIPWARDHICDILPRFLLQ